MTEERVKRKLSAILSADVEGYSRLMGEDEVSTVKTLEAYRKVMADLIEQFRGRVVDSPGDNLLAEFSSVVDAVQCAVEIHEVIRAKNEDLPEDRRMLFRIGVNLGDVIQEGERIYGDGVNIAARLEGLAEPGGVCISGSAHEQIENKLALGYEYLGEHAVKNIAKPVKVYKVPMGAKALILEKKKAKKPKLKKQSTTPGAKEGTEGTGPGQIFPWIAVAVILTAIIVGAVIWNLKPTEPRQVMRSEFELPEGQLIFPRMTSLAVSPDGSRFIYCTYEGIRIRSLTDFDSRLIPGTDGAQEPCFSPDGQWICYYSPNDGQLKKISITGGAPVSLTKISTYPYGSPDWSEDDWIVYGGPGAIMRIPASGGTPETLLKVRNGISPQILPGGKSVLFTTMENNSFRVEVQSLDSGERRGLFEGDTARYLRTGHIVYMLEKNLFAVAFDPDRLEVKGGPVSLVEDIFQYDGPQYAVSQSGTLVYVPGTSESEPKRTLVWVDRNGKEEPISAEPKAYGTFKVSPDGTKVALTVLNQGSADIWIWDMVREDMTRLTMDEAGYSTPLWTPDGQRIVFNSGRDGGVYSKAADGAGEVDKLCSVTGRALYPWSWSGDGKTLALLELPALNKSDIGILSMEGDHERTSLLNEEYAETSPKISPDGKWLAYASDESGETQIYVRPFPEVNKGRRLVSVNGGFNPLWAPDGREIFYLKQITGDSVMAVPVETEQDFKPGKPEVLFQGTYLPLWDISPDGKHFLMMKEVGASAVTFMVGPSKINIVMNWDEELKQRVPVD